MLTEAPTDEQARAAAREILSREEFARGEQGTDAWLALLERLIAGMPDWLVDLLRGLEAGLGSLLSWLARTVGLFGVFGDVSEGIGWIAACLLLAAMIVAVWRWHGAREAGRRRPGSPLQASRRHADALREARALARAGRFLEAAHAVQLACLALLIELDWLELARSDPNRTLRRRIAVSPLPERERGQLVALVDRLESLWFAEPRDDPMLFEDWLALDERIVSLSRGGARGGRA